ncbi:hypothetical protein JB92DRAFT_752373 [Gautieria morchelliformis]|nr:hypothetical protein JB92DRAFT_752373 [Gautieria morchelliformis]
MSSVLSGICVSAVFRTPSGVYCKSSFSNCNSAPIHDATAMTTLDEEADSSRTTRTDLVLGLFFPHVAAPFHCLASSIFLALAFEAASLLLPQFFASC